MIQPSVEIEIVRADARAFRGLAELEGLLSGDERQRFTDFKVEEAAKSFLLARGLLRRELGIRRGVDPRALVFEVRPSGKPDVRTRGESEKDVRFSVSHTGPFVALAFSGGVDVGIDIERTDRVAHPLQIAERYFTAAEFEALRNTPPADLALAFFSGWTRKEAIVKARGSTMAESLTTVAVNLDPRETHPAFTDAAQGPARPGCALTSFAWPESGVVGAVARLGGASPRLRVRDLAS